MQEFCSEFLLFVTSEAQEYADKDGRKTITGPDVLFALKHLGFDKYFEMVDMYHKKIVQAK